MNDRRTINVDFEKSGQARAYGPTERKVTLTFSREGRFAWTPTQDAVKRFASAVIGHDVHSGDDEGLEWWMERFVSVNQAGRGVWKVHTYQEYLD